MHFFCFFYKKKEVVFIIEFKKYFEDTHNLWKYTFFVSFIKGKK